MSFDSEESRMLGEHGGRETVERPPASEREDPVSRRREAPVRCHRRRDALSETAEGPDCENR